MTFNKSKLDIYNEELFIRLKKKYEHFQIGFFNSNKILFVGQNPGKPFKKEHFEEIQRLREFDDFRRYESEYTQQWRHSIFGVFLGQLIDDRWDDISFVNYVKIPTENNSLPDSETTKKFDIVFRRQVELLDPKYVVCFGKFAGKNVYNDEKFFGLKKIGNRFYTTVPHPAFLLRIQDEGQTEKTHAFIKGLLDKASAKKDNELGII